MKQQMIKLLLGVTAVQAESLLDSIEKQQKLASEAPNYDVANLHLAASRAMHKSLQAAQLKIEHLLKALKNENTQ